MSRETEATLAATHFICHLGGFEEVNAHDASDCAIVRKRFTSLSIGGTTESE